MQIIRDVYSDVGRELVERMISKYGCAAEHNYYCYIEKIHENGAECEPFVFLSDIDREMTDNGMAYMGILAVYNPKNKEYRVFTELLAPKERKAELLNQFLDYVYSLDYRDSKNLKDSDSKDSDSKDSNSQSIKVWVELETDTRKNVLKQLKHTSYKCNSINYTLIWPVFEMNKWTGDLMQGGEWKDMRYYWNKFFKDHKVEFVTADKVSKDELKTLVYNWKKTRTTGDRAYIDYYIAAIDSGFKGYDVTRIMLVDGKVGAITAGFNARKGYYYDSIGLYDTEIARCNEIANMDDLIHLKKLGYELVDFGGIEKKSLEFKKKFRPSYYYKTHIFSIVKRD